MQNKILRTPVDDLVDFVMKNKVSTIKNIHLALGVPLESLEKWLVVLEEYNVIKVHYSGFDGFVSFNDNSKKEEVNKLLDINNIKDEFVKKAKKRNIDSEKLKELWEQFVEYHEKELQMEFYKSAKLKGLKNKASLVAWDKYRRDLVHF